MAKARIRVGVRREVGERAGHRCEYCLSPASYIPDGLSIEHILPRARSGSDTLDNLALSCQCCNNLKGVLMEANDSETRQIVSLYHPRQHRWSEHFQWSEDRLYLMGRTPTGRATIERLQLNREGVVNLRGLLIPAGQHPPPVG